MAFDPFINASQPFTQAQLETQLRALQEQYLTHQKIIATGAGDTNVSMLSLAGLETSIETIYRRLNLLDPATYPLESIVRIDRSKIRFAIYPTWPLNQ
jgi:hypothetical protein